MVYCRRLTVKDQNLDLKRIHYKLLIRTKTSDVLVICMLLVHLVRLLSDKSSFALASAVSRD